MKPHRKQNKFLLLVLVFSICGFNGIIQAQTVNSLQLNFHQDFNNYLWQSNFSYHTPLFRKQRLFLQQNYQANLLETSGYSQNWKDNHQLKATYLYRLHPNWSGMATFESIVFADKQSGFQNSYKTHAASLGITTEPSVSLRLQALVGVKADERFGKMNSGFLFHVQSESGPLEISGYQNQLTGLYEAEQFQGRNNFNVLAGYQVVRYFENNTSDSLRYQFNLRRRAYFISQSGDLESRLERLHQFANFLRYSISERLQFRLNTFIALRSSSVDQTVDDQPTGVRKRNDSQFLWEALLLWRGRNIRSQLGWSIQDQSQEFQISRSLQQTPYIGRFGIPDNDSHANTLRGMFSWQISQRDSLNIGFMLSRFQYDTPDSNNYDDRDEFRSNVAIGYRHQFFPGFWMGVETRANLLHLVYLFKEKSVNNNWNRILQLRGFQQWTGSGFRFYQLAEVLSNYTSYDFESLQDQIRSFVYRKFTLTDSLTLGGEKTLRLLLFHRLELEENGRLFWKTFSEQRLVNRRNQYFSAGVIFSLWGYFEVYQGISGYLRKEWRFKPQPGGSLKKEFWGDFFSFGPQLKIFLLHSGRRNAFISLARFHVKSPSNQEYVINQVDLNMHWYF